MNHCDFCNKGDSKIPNTKVGNLMMAEKSEKRINTSKRTLDNGLMRQGLWRSSRICRFKKPSSFSLLAILSDLERKKGVVSDVVAEIVIQEVD